MLRKSYWASAGLLFAALLVFLVVRFTAANRHPDAAMASSTASSVPQSAPHEAPPPLRISAAQLYAEYDQNAVAANDEFAGRTLEVSGKILSAAHASGGMTRLRIAVDQYGLNDIEAQIADASDAPLKKGQPVTLLCTDLSRAQGSLTLDRCSMTPAD
jgi:hypothetical protein